jgi:hypothetical protein
MNIWKIRIQSNVSPNSTITKFRQNEFNSVERPYAKTRRVFEPALPSTEVMPYGSVQIQREKLHFYFQAGARKCIIMELFQ